MINEIVMGKCSLCGGDVIVPAIWHGINKPVMSCSRCGAVAKSPKKPIIEMIPIKKFIPFKD